MCCPLCLTTSQTIYYFVLVQFLNHVRLFVTLWTAAHKVFLSLLKLMSIESAIQPSHSPTSPLLLPSIFSIITVFSDELALRIRWPKYWSFRFSISSLKTFQDWFPLGWTGLISLQSKELSSLIQHHNEKTSVLQDSAFFTVQPSYPYMSFDYTDLCWQNNIFNFLYTI